MKSSLQVLLLALMLQSDALGQASVNTVDLNKAPILQSQSSSSEAEQPRPIQNPDGSLKAFHIPLPIKVRSFAISTVDDAIFVWGIDTNDQYIMLLISLVTGDVLVQKATDLEIVGASLNAEHVFAEVESDEKNLIQLQRSDLTEVARFKTPPRSMLASDYLIVSEKGECYALPDMKKLEIPSDDHFLIPGQRQVKQFSGGFVWKGILWSRNLKPQLLLDADGFEPLVKGTQEGSIKCELWAVGDVLFSKAPLPRELFGYPNLHVPIGLHAVDGTVGFFDPHTLKRVTSLPWPKGGAAFSSQWMIYLEEFELKAIPLPTFRRPVRIESRSASHVLKTGAPTTLSYRSEGAKNYQLEVTGLPGSALSLTSETGDFQVDLTASCPRFTRVSHSDPRKCRIVGRVG